MATEKIPYKDTYKEIVDRFPKSLATDHIKSNRTHEVTIVKAQLGKIIYGKDTESGYTSPRDTEDAKRLLKQLELQVREV
jgi:hypothetical protein